MFVKIKKSGRIYFYHAARFLFQPLVDFVFPPFCHLCQASVTAQEYPICSQCSSQLERISPVLICADDYNSPIRHRFTFSHSIAALVYDEQVQRLIHHFKYNHMPVFKKTLGDILAQSCLQCDEFLDVDFIIPVPLYISRLRERGYNQAELLAHQVAAVTKLPCRTNILKRTRNTKQQVKCSGDERIQNVHGAFTVINAERVQDAKIALVDDVMTTGGTMNECATVLLNAGARQIMAITAVRIANES